MFMKKTSGRDVLLFVSELHVSTTRQLKLDETVMLFHTLTLIYGADLSYVNVNYMRKIDNWERQTRYV